MKNLVFFLIFIASPITTLADNFVSTPVMNKAIPGRYDEGYRSPEQQAAIIKLIDIYRESGEYAKGMLGFVPYSADVWYSLNRKLKIQGGNIVTQHYLGGWPLTRWPYQYYSPDIKSRYKDFSSASYPLPFEYESVSDGPGCLGKVPLRYGDIEGDSKNELVVFLGGLFVVFSPEYQRIVFSEYLDESDWYTESEAKEMLGGESDPDVAQYISRLWINNSNRRAPGLRAYSKLYFGDFDNDSNADMLAWRKSYKSNAGGDSVKGFTKLRDSWGHFERDLDEQANSEQGVTGEYLPQETEEATVRQWLADNNLTWLDGYPSKSECEGEEGQLIPEMHDPLLNDPEVLPVEETGSGA